MSRHLLSLMQQKIEAAKDYVEATDVILEQRLKLQGFLSEIRTEASLLERRVLESEMRQSIYAEVSEKILDRAIREKYS